MRAAVPAPLLRRVVSPGYVAALTLLAATSTAGLVLLTLTVFEDEQDAIVMLDRPVPIEATTAGVAGLLLACLAAWLLRSTNTSASIGLSVALTSAALPALAGWTTLSPAARAAVLAAAPLVIPGLAQVALGWSAARVSPALRLAYGLAVTAAVVHLVGYNPFADAQCASICHDVPVALEGLVSTSSVVGLTGLLALAAAVVGLSALVRSDVEAPSSVRVAVGGMVAGLAAFEVLRLFSEAGTTWIAVLTHGGRIAVVVVAVVVLGALVRNRTTRIALDRLLHQLEQPTSVADSGRSRAAVRFAVPGEGRWVDESGRDVADWSADARSLTITDASGPVVRLLLPSRATAYDIRNRLTPARRLALSNARLTALAHARLHDAVEAQLRGIRRSDAERRRIERDLHDGAQQSLVSASIHLSVVVPRVQAPIRATLTAVQEQLTETIDHLRRISRGAFPLVLEDEGLDVALDELARTADIPVRLTLRGRRKVTSDAAQAAYLVVESTVRALAEGPGAGAADVAVDRGSDSLTLVLTGERSLARGSYRLPVDARDRLTALGGRSEVSEANGRLTLKVVIPCES